MFKISYNRDFINDYNKIPISFPGSGPLGNNNNSLLNRIGMDPVSLVTGGLGLIGSIFSSISDRKAQQQTNQLNWNINERNIAAQENLQDRQMWYNYQMNNEANKYNSYSNQRALMEQAGFNPNSMVSSGNVGSATSQGASASGASVPPPIAMQAAKLDLASNFAAIQGTLADARLKDSQANLANAETGHVNEQMVGQRLNNQLQEITNSFAKASQSLDLQLKDRQIAESDARRMLLNTQRDLAFNELVNLRPLQAMSIVSSTTASNSQDLLNRALAAKSDQDRELAVKNYLLSYSLTGATIAKTLAEAEGQRQQNDLWKVGSGALWHEANNRAWISRYERNSQHLANRLFQDYMKSSYPSLFNQLKQSTHINSVRLNALRSYWYSIADRFDDSSFGPFFPGSPNLSGSPTGGLDYNSIINNIGGKSTSLMNMGR